MKSGKLANMHAAAHEVGCSTGSIFVSLIAAAMIMALVGGGGGREGVEENYDKHVTFL